MIIFIIEWFITDKTAPVKDNLIPRTFQLWLLHRGLTKQLEVAKMELIRIAHSL